MSRRKKPPATIDELLADIEHRADEHRLTIANHLRSELVPRLGTLGVQRVHADYSGHGGSGAIDVLGFTDQSGTPIDIGQRDPAIVHELRRALQEFLPDGFADNEGGQGDLYLDIAAGILRLEHQENFIDTRSSSREWRI